MKGERQDLSERLLGYAANIIKLTSALQNCTGKAHHQPIDVLCNIIRSKLRRSMRCESKPEFIHKIQLVLKELKESLYWLKLARKSALITDDRVDQLLSESQELIKIIAKSIVTARSR